MPPPAEAPPATATDSVAPAAEKDKLTAVIARLSAKIDELEKKLESKDESK